jgi:aspartate aminotransferase/aminotransferase
MVQAAGVTALRTSVTEHVRDYTRKRDLVYELLKDTFELVRPTGGFYVFPKAPKQFASATKFVEAAIARKVLIIPGCVFSERDTHFRVSYAAPDDTIRRGCKILCDLARTAP